MTVTVLLSLGPSDGTTTYVTQLVEGKAPGTRYLYFSWYAALFARYDVFHVHWPEHLLRARNPFTQLCRRALFRLLLLRLRWTRTAVVRTEHNRAPHESGDTEESALSALLDACTTLHICLNPTAVRRPGISVTIPLGHYRDRYEAPSGAQAERGRLLFFGYIRPYKGIDRLIDAFSRAADPDLRLRLVGKPIDVGLRHAVERACAKDPRISARLAFVPDDALAQEVCSAELVVLPIHEMHNSSTVLLALSLGRPVLVPRSPANELLCAEVGPGWMHLYDGDLSPQVLMDGLRAARAGIGLPEPRFEGRDWLSIGQQHYDAYVRAQGDLARR
jgi:beta-1,4-mannosyltransferase